MDAVKVATGVAALLSFAGGVLKKWELIGLSALTVLGVLAYRTKLFGYPPIFDGFDTIVLFSAVFGVTALLSKADLRLAGVVAGALLLGTLFLPTEVKPIPPIIRTSLFFVHVGSALISYAVFLSCSIIALFNKKAEVIKPFRWGFFLFTVSLFFGALWAFLAWGEIFMLDPKSIFSIGFWLFSAFIFHTLYDEKLKNYTRLMVILNGLMVLFLFLGVNFLFGGTHEF